jgi:hypothetical protein
MAGAVSHGMNDNVMICDGIKNQVGIRINGQAAKAAPFSGDDANMRVQRDKFDHLVNARLHIACALGGALRNVGKRLVEFA